MTTAFDVIVLGGGGSGLAAAVSASEAGASVLVLEKAPAVGGSTVHSLGAFSAPLSRLQRKAGHPDSVEQFIQDVATTNGPVEERENEALRRVLGENAGPTLDWMMGMGVRFLGPFIDPPYQAYRLHNVLPSSRTYGEALRRRAVRLGVTILTGTPAEELVKDDTGRVVGVRAGGQLYTAARGVVIATGDFSADPEMVHAAGGEDAEKVKPVNKYNTADGIRLGVAAGGRTTQTDVVLQTMRYVEKRPDFIRAMPPTPAYSRFAAPFARSMPRAMFESVARGPLIGRQAPTPAMYAAGAILVDAAGRRVADETDYQGLVRGIATHGDRGYMVFDQTVATRFSKGGTPVSAFAGFGQAFLEDVKRRHPGRYFEAATVDELAKRLGMPELAAAVQRWNADVAAGRDGEFGRETPAQGLATGPFYALGPIEALNVLTNGGLVIDTGFRVLDRDDAPIPGLYAVGSAGQGGLQLLNNGLHIAWALTSGRLAGKAVAGAAAAAGR